MKYKLIKDGNNLTFYKRVKWEGPIESVNFLKRKIKPVHQGFIQLITGDEIIVRTRLGFIFFAWGRGGYGSCTVLLFFLF